MSPTAIASSGTETASDARADRLRSLMYANTEFMANIRRGYAEGLRGEGIPVDQYFKKRGIV